jgi:hypothetical protein
MSVSLFKLAKATPAATVTRKEQVNNEPKEAGKKGDGLVL